METTLVVKEVALCTRTRCPLLILQEVVSGDELNIPLGVVEACLVGCLLHEDGAGAERCMALLTAALEEATGELVAIEIGRAEFGPWWAELIFRRDDGSARRYRCRPADAAIIAVAFRVPLALEKKEKELEGSSDLDPSRVTHWLSSLSPEDFERPGEEPSRGTPPD
ncbi:DUF151 domain-containing protein [Nitrospinae bacterium AH_259_B05_G02_I21]|nr:DUF151 domain-containing protein [Nitrospinae bacterium AH_259_B05_G02_I21]